MAKDINKKNFDDSTNLKLEIFRECFREWFPVFIYDKWTTEVRIFDFFAGSGMDKSGNFGSPLVLLEESKGTGRMFCKNVKKPVKFIFNEAKKRKSEDLSTNVTNHLENCALKSECGGCVYDFEVHQNEFKNLFDQPEVEQVLKDRKIGKFVLLDQYGFSQVDNDIFKRLTFYPKTDFIFFITSSSIKRFKDHPYVKAYLDTEKIDFNESEPKECHRVIANYFRSIVPSKKEYYIHHFSIQKEKSGNYYGLIFGSNHSLGMEKFIKVCWEKDPFSGESNFNIDNDFESGTLFHSEENTNKREVVSKDLESLVLTGRIKDNITGLKQTLQMGCEPKLFIKVLKKLEGSKKIELEGEVNFSSASIHKIKLCTIKLI